jgi:hypothetical protein
MTCNKCGANCVGRLCQHCERFERRQDAPERDIGHFECPDCGGRTSGKDVTCANCRRRGDV